MKHYETELPEGYREVFSVDAKDKKTILLMNAGNLLLMAAVLIPAWILIRPDLADYTLSGNLIFLGAMCAYIVLHELVHGVVYKLFTRRKLTFGMSLTVAYCGVPDIYVYRTAAMCALLAPFCVFLPVFALPMFLLSNTMDQLLCAVLLALHVGGCIGDLYDTWLYLFRFRDPRTLVRDTGPKQTFYLPEA